MTRFLWLLDFDGTLVDSEKTIRECYLQVCHNLVPERENFIKKMIIGPTLDITSRLILTEKNFHLHEEFKNQFQLIYDKKVIFNTPQYPNVTSTLTNLHLRGDELCIITNKRSFPTQKLINFFGWKNLFKWIFCMDQYPKLKSKSELLKFKKIDFKQYEKIYFVGDTVSDGHAANLLKIPFIRATYGYGNSENWKEVNIHRKIQQFNELLDI